MNRANRPRLSRISGSSYASKLLGRAGDGSTLTLDFTTGQLDPRLTFTRDSNATFINSGGLVQWAASNHAPRTNWNFTSPTGSGWNAATTSGTGTFQWVGDGTVIASSGSSGQAFTNMTSPTGIAEGLRYVMSVTAQSVTGSPTIQSIFDFTSASGNTYFKNGATATAGTTVASGDRISVSAVATSTSMNVRMGCGAWFANRTNESVTLTQFHWHPGSSPVPYYENTATSPRYDSARFDYDPTTLAPRGLLIEGTASNIMFRSQAINTSPWFNAGTMTVSETGSGSPANDATSNVVTWTNGTGAGGAWLQQNVAVSAGSLVVGNAYTWSVWLKSRGGRRVAVFAVLQGASGNREIRVDFGVSPPTVTSTLATGWTSIQTPTIVEYPNGWYKVTTGGTLPAGTTSVNFGISNSDAVPASGTNGFEAWGYQLEAGSGASSYTPTGASTVQRLADFAVINDISALAYSTTNGTLFYAGRFTKINSASYPTRVGFQSAGGATAAFEFFTNGTDAFTAARSASANPEVLTSISLNTDLKWAAAFDAALATGEVRASLNGASVITSSASSLTNTYTPTIFAIGRLGYELFFPFGTIRQVKYWPATLPDSQLQALST